MNEYEKLVEWIDSTSFFVAPNGARLFVSLVFLSEFGGTLTNILLKLDMEVINVAVTYLLGDTVYLKVFFHQHFLRALNSDMVHVGIKILAHFLAEYLAKIGAVVSKERCNIF